MFDCNKLKLPPNTEVRGKKSIRFRRQVMDMTGVPRKLNRSIKFPDSVTTQREAQKFLDNEYSKFCYECDKEYNPECEYKFKDFLEKFIMFHEFGEVNQNEIFSSPSTLSKRTLQSYKDMLPRVVAALGERKLKDIKARNIDNFIFELKKPGVRDDKKFKAKENLINLIHENKLTKKYLSECIGISDKTLSALLGKQNISLKSAFKVSEYFHIDLESIFEVIESNKTLSTKTINNYIAFLSSVFSWAVKSDYIDVNPCRKCQKLKVVRKENPALEKDVLKNFLSKLEETNDLEFILQVKTLLLTGCRRGEMIALKWEDLNLTKATMTIKRSILYNQENKTYVSPTKTNRFRGFTISEELNNLFIAYKQKKKEKAEIYNLPFSEGDYIFTNQNGGLLNPDTFSTKLYRFKNKNGFADTDINSLNFRHTFVTKLIEDEVSVYDVSYHVGHSNINTTLKHYKDTVPINEGKQLSSKMNEIINM